MKSLSDYGAVSALQTKSSFLVKNPLAKILAAFSSILLASLPVSVATAQNAYLQHNLVSDLAGLADNTDTNLLNPWGIAFSATGAFWISDNHAGLSTLYNSSGTPLSLIVNIPPPTGGTPPAAPTGIVFNGTTGFPVAPGRRPTSSLRPRMERLLAGIPAPTPC